jgi:hypothetical protein
LWLLLILSFNSVVVPEHHLTLFLLCAGGAKYGVIVVVVVLGYGYVWWKVIFFVPCINMVIMDMMLQLSYYMPV